jgi:hypothetical protein
VRNLSRLMVVRSDKGVFKILDGCPLLNTLGLTSCRGIPVTQRKNFFEARGNHQSSARGCSVLMTFLSPHRCTRKGASPAEMRHDIFIYKWC